MKLVFCLFFLLLILLILILIKYKLNKFENFNNENRILVLFIFHKYNNRVKKFIDKSIFYDKNIDFIIIINDKSIKFECPKYVKKYYRDNKGYDFGGWSDALLDNNLYRKYKYFIFVNSSVDGPYIKDKQKKWTDIYIEGLKKVNLFGSTINTIKNPNKYAHVQSYIFSMNNETLQYLINVGIFSRKYVKSFKECINNKEILMSKKILENNWNIGSLLPIYKNIDFRKDNSKLIKLDDLMYQKYRNKYWNEYDLVFIKGNRVNITNL